METLQATRLTPFPGTPLFTQTDREGRIFDKVWSHYDFRHVAFQPRQMSAETLHNGAAWVVREFHSARRVAARIWRAWRYLDPELVLTGLMPVNLAYRQGLKPDGMIARASLCERARQEPEMP